MAEQGRGLWVYLAVLLLLRAEARRVLMFGAERQLRQRMSEREAERRRVIDIHGFNPSDAIDAAAEQELKRRPIPLQLERRPLGQMPGGTPPGIPGGGGFPRGFKRTTPPFFYRFCHTPPGIEEEMRRAVEENARLLRDEVKKTLSERAGPSGPGEPPAFDTGKLQKSIRVELDDDGLGAWVGTDLDYAAYLEWGTVEMAARPFLFPTFERMKRPIGDNIRQAATDAAHRAARRVQP